MTLHPNFAATPKKGNNGLSGSHSFAEQPINAQKGISNFDLKWEQIEPSKQLEFQIHRGMSIDYWVCHKNGP